MYIHEYLSHSLFPYTEYIDCKKRTAHTKQIRLIGSTGGNRKELEKIIDMAANKKLKIKVWKKLKLDNVTETIRALSTKERDGRILLDIT
jgi:D-arabinose 1-dehydrogenase-like Zn-dependent alcohol dehydrogenase